MEVNYSQNCLIYVSFFFNMFKNMKNLNEKPNINGTGV